MNFEFWIGCPGFDVRRKTSGDGDTGSNRNRRRFQSLKFSLRPSSAGAIRQLTLPSLLLLLVEKCLQRLANEVVPTLDTVLSGEDCLVRGKRLETSVRELEMRPCTRSLFEIASHTRSMGARKVCSTIIGSAFSSLPLSVSFWSLVRTAIILLRLFRLELFQLLFHRLGPIRKPEPVLIIWGEPPPASHFLSSFPRLAQICLVLSLVHPSTGAGRSDKAR